MKIEIGQIFTQIVSFLVILWVLKRYGWKPLLGVLEERKNKIKSEFDSIEKEKLELATLKEEYQRKLDAIEELSKKKVQDAVESAQKIAQQIQKDAHKEAKETLLQAKEDLQKELSKARVLLKKELVGITLDATKKLLQETVNEDRQKRILEEFMEQRNFS